MSAYAWADTTAFNYCTAAVQQQSRHNLILNLSEKMPSELISQAAVCRLVGGTAKKASPLQYK